MATLCDKCAMHATPAIKAAASGHMACIQALEKQHSLLETDSTGATPLHAAVRTGNLEIAQYLVERAGMNIYAADHVGGTPAHHAAYNGQVEALKWLVEYTGGRAAQISAIDGGTPLHFCTARGHLDCIKYLVEKAKVDVNERDNNGAVPMYFAAQEGYLAVAQFLYKHGGDPLAKAGDGMCAIHAAAQAGRADVLKFLLPLAGSGSAKLKDNDGATPMHFSSAQGHVSCLEFLLSIPGVTGEERDGIQATPAHDAAEQGQLDILKALVNHNADINLHDAESLRPYDLAKEEGHLECVAYIESVLAMKKAARKPVFMAAFQDAPAITVEPESALAISHEEADAAEKDLFVALDDLALHMTQMSAVTNQLTFAHQDDDATNPTKIKDRIKAFEGAPKLVRKDSVLSDKSSKVYKSQAEIARTKPTTSHLRKPSSSSPHRSRSSSIHSVPLKPENAIDTDRSRSPSSMKDSSPGNVPAKRVDFEPSISPVPFRDMESPLKDDYSTRVELAAAEEEEEQPSGCFCFRRRRRVRNESQRSKSSSTSVTVQVDIPPTKSQRLRKSSRSAVPDFPE